MSTLSGAFRGVVARRLPLAFDPAALRRDLLKIPERWWSPGFPRYTDGAYEAVSLLSPSGRLNDLIYGARERGPYRPTAALERCPALAAILEALPGVKYRARLMRLRSGGALLPHDDHDEIDRLRVHVPITTGPQVHMVFDETRVVMAPGQAWCVNLSLPHEVYNFGPRDRVHLVLDLGPDDGVHTLLRRSRPLRRHAPARVDVKALAARYLRFHEQASGATGARRVRRLEAAALQLERLAVKASPRARRPRSRPPAALP